MKEFSRNSSPERRGRSAVIEVLEQRIAPATFIVTTLADSDTGSLRQAILDANALPGLDTVTFAIAGAASSLQAIYPQTPLPTITDAVIIDGYTQGDAHPNTSTTGNNAALRIAIHGDLIRSSNGLILAGAGGSTVKGLVIDGFIDSESGGGYGILVQSGNNTIAGNVLGGRSPVIEREVITLVNDAGGVRVETGSGNTIGGLAPADQNVIVSLGNGIELRGPSSGTRVLGNLIGTDQTETDAIGASGSGILIFASAQNIVGGPTPGARNLISGSLDAGIRVSGLASFSNSIQGNYIGTDITGTLGLGNGVGVQIESNAHDNLVGGSGAGEGNVISGNGDGVVIANSGAKNNVIAGNFIGTNAAGSSSLGNTGDGVKIIGSASDNVIGGALAGARNVISGNGGNGVSLGSNSSIGGGNQPAGDLPGERRLSGFLANSFAANDDGSIAANIGFSVNFFGVVGDALFVNNNGNVTFGRGLRQFTPTALNSANGGLPIIAAFFADVDTRGAGSSLVTYGNDSLAGHQVFGIDYLNVGYFASHTDKLNSFQLLLIDRGETGSGNFDIEFDYYQILWETGDASSGAGGLGGTSARVGYSNGTGTVGTFFELAGSGVNGAFLDSGPGALKQTSIGSTVPGRIRLEVRDGLVQGSPSGNTIQGNYIGTDRTGALDFGNGDNGVLVDKGSKSNQVIGNVISANLGNGITLSGTDTTLNVARGNKIGVNAAGTGALANGLGVSVTGGASGNTIGGTALGDGNRIAFNGRAPATGDGVFVGPGSFGNSILGNVIDHNLGEGIRLGTAVGSQPGNHGQVAPVLNGAYRLGTDTVFVGTLQSAPAAQYRVELFASDGTGEASAYFGAVDVTTDATGLASFAQQLPVATSLGQLFTATATRKDTATTFGDSSAFATASKVAVAANISDAASVEGDAGGGKLLTFTVTLGELHPSGATVFYHTAPFSNDARSATADVDYAATTGSVQFSATELSKTVSIPILGDLLAEGRERFEVLLDNSVNAVPVDDAGIGTIIDDDQSIVLTGSGTGSKVQVLNSITGDLLRSFNALEADYHGGVRVASGDVTGDGINDIVTATGTGGGARVRIFSGADASANPVPILTFQPFPKSYRGTLHVAAGDVDGDGHAEVIVSTGSGSLAEARVFDVSDALRPGQTPTLLSRFTPFGKVSGGVHVAAGDFDGDGLTEWVITNGNTSEVRIYHGNGTPLSGVLGKFQGFPNTVRNGLFATAGDLNGDGRDEVIVGTAKGGAKVTSFTMTTSSFSPAFLPSGFSPFSGNAGVRLAVTDINRDGIAEIVATHGVGSSALRIFESGTGNRLNTINALSGSGTSGIFIA